MPAETQEKKKMNPKFRWYSSYQDHPSWGLSEFVKGFIFLPSLKENHLLFPGKSEAPIFFLAVNISFDSIKRMLMCFFTL